MMGQSDDVVLQIQAIPAIVSATYQIPGPYLYGSYTAVTFPFRARGTQIRVVNEQKAGMADALVYKLLAGQDIGGRLVGNGNTPYHTDRSGYLAGRGELRRGEKLFALAPMTITNKYTIYHTSAPVTTDGLLLTPIETGGVQTLTVSAANPLMLFPITVSLEWDASRDEVFIAQLRRDLANASDKLYDWTNGQVALGQVVVYQNKEYWEKADVRILASNQVRPNAFRGGVVTNTQTITVANRPVIVTPGPVRIGPNWNRYGEAGIIENDWPNALAHEFGHYLLYLEDRYLGLDTKNRLIAITTCGDSAMSDPYSFSEFANDDSAFQPGGGCEQALPESSDWSIIIDDEVYAYLHPPTAEIPGPTTIPFAFTAVTIITPTLLTNTPALIDDVNVQLGDWKPVGARAYLISSGQRILDLGAPVGSTLLARGARLNDEVCVFAGSDFACGIFTGQTILNLSKTPAWQPEITLTPVDLRHVAILVNEPVSATIYPEVGAAISVTLIPGVTTTVTLTGTTSQTETARSVLIDLRGSGSNQRTLVSYAIGGGPTKTVSHGTFASTDASATLYPPQELGNDDILVLQTAIALPPLPQDLVQIGRAFNVRANITATHYTMGSIAFQYLQLELLVSGLPEDSLAIHYWNGQVWERLETVLNQVQNYASAELPGPGIYVLTAGVSKLDIAQLNPPFTYSGQSQTVTITRNSTQTYYLTPLTVTLTSENGSACKLLDGSLCGISLASVKPDTIVVTTPVTLPPDLYDVTIAHPGSEPATLSDAFAVYTKQPATACFFDDFNSGLGKWTKEPTNSDWGIVFLIDGREALTDSPGHPYASADPGTILTTTLTTQAFDLTACVNPVLTFRHDYELLTNDRIRVDISVDNGLTWQPLAKYTGQAIDVAAAAVDDEWKTVHWQTEVLTLADFGISPNSTQTKLRFTIVTDDFASARGWIIDEIALSSTVASTDTIPTLQVQVTPSSRSLPAPSSEVSYTVHLSNLSTDVMTITGMEEQVTAMAGQTTTFAVKPDTCPLPLTLASGATSLCTLTVAINGATEGHTSFSVAVSAKDLRDREFRISSNTATIFTGNESMLGIKVFLPVVKQDGRGESIDKDGTISNATDEQMSYDNWTFLPLVSR
jgi:hypothetical protein